MLSVDENQRATNVVELNLSSLYTFSLVFGYWTAGQLASFRTSTIQIIVHAGDV